MKVKITNPATCRAVFEVTRDITHSCKCPIIMEKSTWLAIKPSVMMKKQSVGPELKDIFTDVFGEMFGKDKPWEQ